MPPLLFDILTLGLGLVLLGCGGDLLVRGSVTIAYRLGISPMIVGLTVVAFGTSAPELAFNVLASINHSSGLVFGNIVGSNICNIGLILGIAALIKPLTVHSGLIRREVPVMIGALVAMVAMGYLGPTGPGGGYGFSRLEGVILLLALTIYTWGTIAIALRQRTGMQDYSQSVEDVSKSDHDRPLWRAWLFFLFGLFLLTAGGSFGKDGAVGIAQTLSIPDEIIGLTIIAIGTSLPELTTVLIAIRKGQVDMAIGNIIGSNIFNVLFVFGMSVTISPVDLPEGAFESLAVMIGCGVMLLLMSRTRSGTLSRFGGSALLTVYTVYLAHQSLLAITASRAAAAATL